MIFALFLNDLMNISKSIDQDNFRLVSKYNPNLWELYQISVIYNYQYFKYYK